MTDQSCQPVSVWRPIATAPRDGTPVDLWHKIGARLTDLWWAEEDKCWSDTRSDEEFTHWMPLPAPPSPSHGLSDAEFIVKAVNNHVALVEALSGLIEAVRRDCDIRDKGISGYTSARLSDARSALAGLVGGLRNG
jgi:hypothetical protein